MSIAGDVEFAVTQKVAAHLKALPLVDAELSMEEYELTAVIYMLELSPILELFAVQSRLVFNALSEQLRNCRSTHVCRQGSNVAAICPLARRKGTRRQQSSTVRQDVQNRAEPIRLVPPSTAALHIDFKL